VGELQLLLWGESLAGLAREDAGFPKIRFAAWATARTLI
jgi:hypothetical protein